MIISGSFLAINRNHHLIRIEKYFILRLKRFHKNNTNIGRSGSNIRILPKHGLGFMERVITNRCMRILQIAQKGDFEWQKH
jgi:hypothetical protein